MEIKVFPKQFRNYEPFVTNNSTACLYEENGIVGYWKDCAEATKNVLESESKEFTSNQNIDWSNINVLDLKTSKNQTTEKTFIYLDHFFRNYFPVKTLHISNWTDTNFFNDSFFSIINYLTKKIIAGDVTLELVNKPKKNFSSFFSYKKHILSTLKMVQNIDISQYVRVDYFYYFGFKHGKSTWVPIKENENYYDIFDTKNWKLYDSLEFPSDMKDFDKSNWDYLTDRDI